MKNILRFGLFAALATVSLSCTKETIDTPSGKSVLTPMTFTATNGEVTKTYLDGKTVKWHESDVIGIHDGYSDAKDDTKNKQFTIKSINADGSAVFEGTAAAGQETYYASYPYDANNFVTDQGKMRIAFMSNQTASAPGTFDQKHNSSAAVLKDGVFNFKNLGGLLKFTLTQGNVKQVTLTAADKGTVGGVYFIYFDENGNIDELKTTMPSNGARPTMTLKPAESSTFAPGTYYFVLSARTYVGGMSISFALDNGKTMTATCTEDIVVERSKITSIGTYDTTYQEEEEVFTPVTFPVVFPMGYPEGATAKEQGYNYPAPANSYVYDGWYSSPACGSGNAIKGSGQYGTLYSKEQPQAKMQWNWGEDIATLNAPHFIETSSTFSNKSGTWYISTVGIKGVWTGDFFEFILPVENFEAETTLQLNMPILSTNGPVFWEVLYLDGDQWRSTAVENLQAYEGATVTATATWAIPYTTYNASPAVNTLQTVDMTFANAIKKGEIRIKVKCVDGRIQGYGVKTVETKTTPRMSSEKCSANFYIYNPADRNNSHITIDIVNI